MLFVADGAGARARPGCWSWDATGHAGVCRGLSGGVTGYRVEQVVLTAFYLVGAWALGFVSTQI